MAEAPRLSGSTPVPVSSSGFGFPLLLLSRDLSQNGYGSFWLKSRLKSRSSSSSSSSSRGGGGGVGVVVVVVEEVVMKAM